MEFSLEPQARFELMFTPEYTMPLLPSGVDFVLRDVNVLNMKGCLFKLLYNFCKGENLIVRFHQCERNIYIGKFLSWMAQCGIGISFLEQDGEITANDFKTFLTRMPGLSPDTGYMKVAGSGGGVVGGSTAATEAAVAAGAGYLAVGRVGGSGGAATASTGGAAAAAPGGAGGGAAVADPAAGSDVDL